MQDKHFINESISPLVYWLNIEDVQKVALDKLQRVLTKDEISKLINPINQNIDWFDAISSAIDTNL